MNSNEEICNNILIQLDSMEFSIGVIQNVVMEEEETQHLIDLNYGISQIKEMVEQLLQDNKEGMVAIPSSKYEFKTALEIWQGDKNGTNT